MGVVLAFPVRPEECPPATPAAEAVAAVIAVKRTELVTAVMKAGGNFQAPEVLAISLEIDVLVLKAHR